MSDANQLLLLLAAAQQQQAIQQLAKLQKPAATPAAAAAPAPNAALAQQIAQIAQMGALMAAQKNGQSSSSSSSSSSTAPATTTAKSTADTMALWQQAMQMHALQQMMMTPQKNQMEEAIKKMMEMAKKKESAPATTASTSPAENNVMNNMMWQLVAQQMQNKQQQQSKESQKKAEQLKKAKELAKQQQKEQDAKTKQQEEIVKFLMAQHQLNHQKKQQQKKQEEAAALAATVLAAKNAAVAASGDGPDGEKRLNEAMVRLPIQLGWRRQTCVRNMTSSGVRGDVSYFAPCGKKLGTYSEVVRYLAKNGINYINRDNFAFTTKLVIGEFIVPKEGDGVEKEFVIMSEEEVNKKLQRLSSLKTLPKMLHDEEVVKMEVVVKSDEPEEPLDPAQLNDEFHEDLSAATSSGFEECKIREREADDLLVNASDVRHLPEFARIENQCLDSQGFADALMIHEFVQNFGHVLGIDLERAPKLESLCAGLAGDAAHADSFLRLTRQLLRLALEFPGMGNEKRFGQGGGEMGLDRENFSEVMRLFLVDKGSRGEELSRPLSSANFIALRAEQKSAILAFLCDELVCSRNVVAEIDRNLDEISRLRGEKWMREGKARALRSARTKKRSDVVPETDSEPPTRPVTPKKPAAAASTTAVTACSPAQKKFTPGIGLCEVLTEQEESMSLAEMDALIGSLHVEAQTINQKIHDTSLRVRTFPFGTDRFHRNYWLLAHTEPVIVESTASAAVHNPACNVAEIAARDPPAIEVPEVYMDEDVVACVEDLIDEVVLVRARADKKTRKRYRRVDNQMKRGWWTMQNRDCVESLRSALLGRGIRERALHRLLTKPWFLNDLKFGTICLDPVTETINTEKAEKQGWIRLNSAIDRLQSHMKMADVARDSGDVTTEVSEAKPVVVPTTMALAQIVKDDEVEWSMFDEALPAQPPNPEDVRRRILETAEMVDPKFWRPAFRTPQLYDEWKTYVNTEAADSPSRLMVALQTIEGMVMWERSAREALCQICKSMDGDEMLVCDGCESGCHMECFRPRMTKVPDGDWYCQRCREEKSGRPVCMFCSKEVGGLLQCQRCAYHTHQECAQENPKDHIDADHFVCSHCQEMKQMRFAKRIMMRGESEERDSEEPEPQQQQQQQEPETSTRVNLKRRMEPSSVGALPVPMNKELCQLMLDELEAQTTSFPFLEPVNPKLVPGYKMVIVKPIDLGTIRQKNEKMMYETPEDFAEDIELMFANCRQYNIDHSEIGRAGISLNKFFQKRWKQLKYNFTKRLRRLHRHN